MTADEWRKIVILRGLVGFDVPPGWSVEDRKEFHLIANADGSVAIGVMAAVRPGATLADFAQTCFRNPAETLKAVGDQYDVRGDGWETGVAREFEAGPDDQDEYQRMFCLCNGALFAKVTIYSDRDHSATEETTQKFIRSIQLSHVTIRTEA